MEIIFKNVYYDIFKGLNFSFTKEKIIGITGDNTDIFVNYFKTFSHEKGSIYFNKEKKEDLMKLKSKFEVVENNLINEPLINTVKEYIVAFVKENKLRFRDYDKKIKDSLKIVTLNDSYLNKDIKELSKSEKQLFMLSLSLLKNPDFIILNNTLNGIDMKTENKLMLVFKKLVDNYHKTVIIVSNDPDLLYRDTKKIIMIKDRGIFLSGHTTDIYEDNIENLLINNFQIPEIVLFTYKAKTRKKVNIDYQVDIRDLIKDIYKHV